MTEHDIYDRQREIYKSLHDKHLQQAFGLLKVLVAELQEWSLNEELTTVETSYRYMIQYMMDGVDDPNRHEVHNHLLLQTYRLAETVCERLLTHEASTLYYSKKRTLAARGDSMRRALENLDADLAEVSIANLLADGRATDKRRRVEYRVQDLFDRVWTNFPATAEDYATIATALQPDKLSAWAAALITSAVTMNVMHRFDEEKTGILIDTYRQHPDVSVQMRALCGVFLIVLQHNDRLPLHEKLTDRLSLLMDDTRFVTDMRNILLQFVRSRDTEHIVRKMNEEVLPRMMKLSPELYKKIKEDDALNDIEALERNPEWQEIIDKWGIADRLQEINDLQLEGADVFMSTFSHLKGFPFFNEFANWFMPFDVEHTAVTSLFGRDEQGERFAQLIAKSGFMCNSDKYSFCLSLGQVPESQRRMMAAQLGEENLAMQEAAAAELYAGDKERENASNRYLQDLYRLTHLHPRRGEMIRFFNTPIDEVMNARALQPITGDPQLMRALGEYFFKREVYDDAVYFFAKLAHTQRTDNDLYQKTGYCYQATDHPQQALEYYLKADLIKPDQLWTLRHIATCYRNLKQTADALTYLQRAEALAPDNLSINLNIGHCYLEMKQYDKALQYYFKVDYLDTRGTKARRPIAWCAFLAGKKEQAQQYYDKILEQNPGWLDYLNAGHVAFAMGNLKQAQDLYLHSIEHSEGSASRFTQEFEQDTPDLLAAGIDPGDLAIVYDQVMYKASQAE